jgi:hypothetical protein
MRQKATNHAAVLLRGAESPETGDRESSGTGSFHQPKEILKKETVEQLELVNGQNRQRITNPGGTHNIPPENKKSSRYIMKKLFKRFFAVLKAWERRTDAEFAGMDEIQRQQITDFINSSTY